MFKRRRRNPVEFAQGITPIVPYGDAVVKAYEFVEMQRTLRHGWEGIAFPREDIACYGCAHGERCCTLVVMTSLPEAIVLVHQLNAMGRFDTLRALIDQGERQAVFVGTDLYAPGPYPNKIDLWCDKQETCVLLDENNRCSVYNWAPFTCRAYFVTHEAACVAGPLCTTSGHSKSPMADYERLMMEIIPKLAVFSNEVAGGFIMPTTMGQMVKIVVDAWGIDVGVLGNPPSCKCGSGLNAKWVNDARGIPLAKVCPACREEVLSRYRPGVLTGYRQGDMIERIEPERDTYEEETAYEDGMVAGQTGFSPKDCPYTDPRLRTAWLEGFLEYGSSTLKENPVY